VFADAYALVWGLLDLGREKADEQLDPTSPPSDRE
jgi:hypothetical protein